MLIITRASVDFDNSANKLVSLGFSVMSEPMFEVEYVADRTTSFEQYDVVVVTSRHGVEAMSRVTEARDMRLMTAGDSTLARARDLGFANSLACGGTSASLLSGLKSLSSSAKVLYVRGEYISKDLAEEAKKFGLNIAEKILYRMVARTEVSQRCLNLLTEGQVAGVLFYSRRTAQIFIKLMGQHRDVLRHVFAYTISQGALEILRPCLWKGIFISTHPTENSLIGLLEQTLPTS